MSVISGKGGNLSQSGDTTGVSTMRNWAINYTASNPGGVAGNTGGSPVVLAGPTDWDLRYDFYGKTLPATPGTSYSLIGYNGSERFTGTVLAESFALNCDIAAGGLLSGSVTAKANSALTLVAGAAVTDTSEPRIYSTVGCKARWQPIVAGSAGSLADLPDVLSWSLNMGITLNPYHTSDTSGGMRHTAGVYQPGSIGGSVTILQGSLAALTASATRITPGAYGALRLHVNSTEFFALTYVVIDANDIPVDIEGGANNEVTVPWRYTRYTNVSGTLTAGNIALPDTSNFFS